MSSAIRYSSKIPVWNTSAPLQPEPVALRLMSSVPWSISPNVSNTVGTISHGDGKRRRHAPVVPHRIEGRGKAEGESRRAIRALRVLLAGKKAVIRNAAEPDLYRAVCGAITDEGGYPLTWIALPEFNDRKSVRIAASAGVGGDYLHAIELTWGQGATGNGPVGTCLRSGADHGRQPHRERPAVSTLARPRRHALDSVRSPRCHCAAMAS